VRRARLLDRQAGGGGHNHAPAGRASSPARRMMAVLSACAGESHYVMTLNAQCLGELHADPFVFAGRL
jgi:hypothetical protein